MLCTDSIINEGRYQFCCLCERKTIWNEGNGAHRCVHYIRHSKRKRTPVFCLSLRCYNILKLCFKGSRLSVILERETSWLLVCSPAHQNPSENGSALKGKNLLPTGANSFLVELTHFQKEAKLILIELPPLKWIYMYSSLSKKTDLAHVWIEKISTSLHMRTVWSASSLFVYGIIVSKKGGISDWLA